jgi:hypothetical protein
MGGSSAEIVGYRNPADLIQEMKLAFDFPAKYIRLPKLSSPRNCNFIEEFFSFSRFRNESKNKQATICEYRLLVYHARFNSSEKA